MASSNPFNEHDPATNTPPPHALDAPLAPPNPRFDSFAPSASSMASPAQSANNSVQMLNEKDASPRSSAALDGDNGARAGARPKKSRRNLWIALAALAIIIVAAAIAVPVAITSKNKSGSDADASNAPGSNGGGSGNNPNSPTGATSGGDGSQVTTEDGTTFTYVNKFGGRWVWDPKDPFNNGAKPNSWTPALNETWDWNTNRIYGVNLGGLFVLEPFIVPAPYEKYTTPANVINDEWALSIAMAADTASGGLNQLEDHYNTFITEQDIAEIAAAGLNWVRLPVPFWAIESWDGEPFLEKVCWKYILRVFQWCRKYGIRIKLDLHSIPGSQNGYNHSGKFGQIDFLNGVMGYANAQRALGYIRIFAQFISQPEYKDVVPMFGIINEPRMSDIGKEALSNFYYQAYSILREVGGQGAGNGPFMVMADGFAGLAEWADFLPGADRLAIDMHPYFAFNGEANTDPVGVWPQRACERFSEMVNASMRDFGVSIAGEFSNAINDCGLFLNGVGGTHTYADGGDCSFWEDSAQWNQTVKDGLRDFAYASFDSLRNWFFWTWKIGNSTTLGHVGSPLWSYQLGLQEGWMPQDPREADGYCNRIGVTAAAQAPATFQPWQTGGAGAGTIAPAALATVSAWPPAAINNAGGAAVAVLPSYTPTGVVSTLPPPTFAAATPAATPTPTLDGWTNDADTAGMMVEVAGCTYPDPWNALNVAAPAAACVGPAARLRGRVVAPRAAMPLMTPPPL